MTDWAYVALGYGGTIVVLGGYCLRLVLRARQTRASQDGRP